MTGAYLVRFAICDDPAQLGQYLENVLDVVCLMRSSSLC
jgi:hypothetical protein